LKAVTIASLLALLIGLGAGAVLERDRRQRASVGPESPAASSDAASSAGAASADRVAALEAELGRVRSRLEALESRPAAARDVASWFSATAGVRPVADPGPELAALRAEMAALVEKRDGEGLLYLARRLAALGEAGYPAVMEIAKLLLDDEVKDPREFGDVDLDGGLFVAEFMPLMAWALAHPELSPPRYRVRAADELAVDGTQDVAQLFLRVLRTESDPEVVTHLCEGIAYRMRAGIVSEVEAAARRLHANGAALENLLSGISSLDSPAATEALTRLSAPELPAEVRERAKARLLLYQDPPESGYLVLGVESGSGWHGGGLRTGDLILEMNGSPVVREETMTAAAVDGSMVEQQVVVSPLMNIGEEETVVLRVLRDGEIRTVTVKGNDGRWRGAPVKKAEPE
jgi:hypothetical protein